MPNPVRVLCLLFAVTLVFAGCGGAEPTATAPAAGEPAAAKAAGTLRVATSADNKTIDPALLTTNPDVWTTDQVYDKLVERGLDMTVRPELAISWEHTADLTSYTFRLRPGVTFHSGKALTADDVVFSIKRLLDPAVASPASSVLGGIKHIEAVDGLTVRFDLNSPSAFLPDLLTAYQAKVLNSQADPATFATGADGTGPFTLQEYKPGERAVLKRNPDYWGDGPYVEEVIFFYMPSNQARIEALKTGAVDVVYPLAPTAVADLQKSKDTKVSSIPSASYLTLAMDNQQAPFDNKLVRQAVQAATNREAINKAAMLGYGTVGADIAIPPNDPNFPPGVMPVGYDVQRAKRLLADAGYPNGIDITLHASDVFPGLVEMAVALKESAAPAGIRIAISRDPEETFWDKVWLQEPFVTVNWFGRDPDSALSINVLSDAPWNESNFRSKEADALVLKARGQTNPTDRQETYRQLQALLADNAGRIIPVFMPVFMGLAEKVEGLSAHPTNFMVLETARLD